jgi:hypothetical protein
MMPEICVSVFVHIRQHLNWELFPQIDLLIELYNGVDRKQARRARERDEDKGERKKLYEGREKIKSDVYYSYLKPLFQMQKLCSVERNGNSIMNNK